jgi:hypothetical protein
MEAIPGIIPNPKRDLLQRIAVIVKIHTGMNIKIAEAGETDLIFLTHQLPNPENTIHEASASPIDSSYPEKMTKSSSRQLSCAMMQHAPYANIKYLAEAGVL